MTLDFFVETSSAEKVFWISAVFGTVFFLLRVLMMVIGGFGAESDHDVSHDSGQHVEADGHDHSHELEGTDTAFKLVSINTMTGFFMMFGWGGLAAYRDFELSALQSIAAALVAGLITMYLTASLFRVALKLTSAGSSFQVNEIVGKVATVYLQIPAQGRGKIQISHDGISRTVEAVSEDGVEIPSFKDVDVVKVVDARTVSVRIRS